MALSKVSYVGNGSIQTFSVTFNYLNRSHVKTFVNGIENTTFTWDSPSIVRLTPAPPNGSIVVIQRVTPTTPIVDFVDGSNLTEANLDTATRQGIFIAEENRDETVETISLDVPTDSFLFLNKRLANVANPVNAQDVATRGWIETSFLGSLTSFVSSASASATSASNSATTATNQANIATTQAGIATAQANIATTQATNASNSASILASLVKATTPQALAGTDDDTFMTPLKTKQAMDANPSGRLIRILTISSTTNYDKTVNNPSFIVVELVGGGAGANIHFSGASGGYSRKRIANASLANTTLVTIGGGGGIGGNGGTTSFGSHVSATGGNWTSTGFGGEGINGDVNVRGGDYGNGGYGAPSYFGSGRTNIAVGNGAWGGGGFSNTIGGVSGVCIIEEYA